MNKIDLKKTMAVFYNPPTGKFSLVDVPPLNFLAIDGHGDPNTSPVYAEAVEALYSLAYTIKFAVKKLGTDYTVAPLEGLWWVEDMAEFSIQRKDQWDWRMLIMQPEPVEAALVEQCRAEALKKKGLAALERIELLNFHEGLAMQIMYLGAYADEGPTIARLHTFIAESGYERSGRHHEIYLGDPRRAAPEKLKTVIRQPMRKAINVCIQKMSEY